MAIKTKTGYECSYCKKEFNTFQKADACRNSHDIIYIGLSAEDVNRLHNFLYSGNTDLLSEGIYSAIKKAVKRAAIGKLNYDED